MKLLKIAALVAAMGAVGAQANVVITSVTGTSSAVNSAFYAADGNFPAFQQDWQVQTAWWYFNNDSVVFTFDQPYQITGMTISVDNNDYYRVYLSADGTTWDDYHTVLAFEGLAGYGMDEFSPSKPATAQFYSYARVTALAGDGSNSVGELQFNGVAAPIPEPETLALMLGGLAALGLKLRRRAG
jgi:hypothetical protein